MRARESESARCAVCGRTLPRRQLVSGALVRPSVADAIRADHPEWGAESRVCRDDLAVWDEQSPGFLEAENVFRVCYFGEKAGCPVNIVHMSAGESLELVRRLRRP